MPRTKLAATALLLAACTVASVEAPAAARDPLTPRDFPGVERVAKVFPSVTSRELDTLDGGNPAYLPHCAREKADDIAAAAPEAELGFWASYASSGGGQVGVVAEAFRFANRSQAARSMRAAAKALAACSGLEIGVESYSRYREFRVPRLGDDRLAYVGGYEYDFEPGYRGGRQILVRDGRDVLLVTAKKYGARGSKPAGVTSTVKLARLVLKRNPLA